MLRAAAVKMNWGFAAALIALCGAAAACGGTDDDDASGPSDAGGVRARPIPPSGDDGSDAGAEEKDPRVPTSCSPPFVAPMCTTTKAAPTTAAAIDAFLRETAVPIRCDDSDRPFWDLRPLIDLYGSQKIFMLGEFHGSNEIGILSSLLMKELAAKKLVNVVAFEMPIDYTESLQRYVDTGSDEFAESLFEQQAKNFFGTILPKTARELHLKGIPLRVAGVDIPMDPEVAVKAIQAIATKLSLQKNSVLETLPVNTPLPPTEAELTKVNAYFDLIVDEKPNICAELSLADCDRLDAMVNALWAGIEMYDMGANSDLWFARREVVIYYNLRTQIPEGDRMYLHMGAFHTNKHDSSAGSRMAHEYSVTKDQVFSVGPAVGDGSVIWYSEDVPLEGEPASVVRALSSSPPHPLFVSTTRVNLACEANPLGIELDTGVTGIGTRGELYDGYVHYGKLTSEIRPGDTTFTLRSAKSGGALPRGSFQAFRDRVEALERAAKQDRRTSR